MKFLPYDKTNPQSIHNYSKKLINHSFRDILDWYFKDKNKLHEVIDKFDKNNKGGIGNLIEEYFFLKKPDNKAEADFKEAGLELKVTPYEIKKDGSYKAGERLVLSMIPYNKNIEKDFFNSDIFCKINLMLMIFYLRDRTILKLDYQISLIKLFDLLKDLTQNDLNIIIEDYNKISKKIKNGLAHELSESDTMYLGACTKSSNSSKKRKQYKSETPAKPRAFSFKTSFMSNLINTFFKLEEKSEAIFKTYEISNKTFEEKVIDKLSKFYGKDENYLKNLFKIKNNPKNLYNILTCRMLGVSSNSALEFEKANMEIKTIRLEEGGKIIESMSFPAFKIGDLVKENFEESSLFNLFSQTKFIFVVFKKYNKIYKFKGAKFWNMPISILEKEIKKDWELYQKIFIEGVKFKIKNNIVYNNLPKKNNTNVIHVRPHASASAYYIEKSVFTFSEENLEGGKFIKGNLEKDGDMLPNGDIMTKQCFWLNNDFLLNLIREFV